jgi:hypothetical protein
MPSELAITLALLRFGGLDAPEKLRVLDDYQKRSDAEPAGGPHVWNPCVEVIESLWQDTNSCAHEVAFQDKFSREDRKLLGEIAAVAWDLLTKHYSELVSRSVFQSPAPKL